MQTEMSIFSLIANASLVVQLVMLILLAASVFSWSIIFDRLRVLKRARQEADYFENVFWSGIDLSELYQQVERKVDALGMQVIFHAGFREFAKLKKHSDMHPAIMVDGARRSMMVAMNREIESLEGNMSFLASVGSTSPYIGLFGTVWGIMNAFIALGQVKQASLNLVAPGIAEALIATAIGLLAAIPAVLAYNRFASDLNKIGGKYEVFVDEFTSILERQAHMRAS